jgi:hypothetical protein
MRAIRENSHWRSWANRNSRSREECIVQNIRAKAVAADDDKRKHKDANSNITLHDSALDRQHTGEEVNVHFFKSEKSRADSRVIQETENMLTDEKNRCNSEFSLIVFNPAE